MRVAYGWIGDAELSSLYFKFLKFMYVCVLPCLYMHMSRVPWKSQELLIPRADVDAGNEICVSWRVAHSLTCSAVCIAPGVVCDVDVSRPHFLRAVLLWHACLGNATGWFMRFDISSIFFMVYNWINPLLWSRSLCSGLNLNIVF